MWLKLFFCAFLRITVLASPSTWPILGPGYPAPKDLSSNKSSAARSWAEAISTIQEYLDGDRQLPGQQDFNNHTFSIVVFSARDGEAQASLQFHHASPSTRNASLGTRKIDGDSVYRIGSVSKVFTVYLALLKLGSSAWDWPVSELVPELKASAQSPGSNPVDNVDWTQVTLGSLAGQVSGVTRGVIDLDVLYPGLTGAGFLNENYSDKTANDCFFGRAEGCTEEQWLQEIDGRPPTHPPWSTPVYSNAGYDVLALALERATGEHFTDMMRDKLLGPLKLTSVGLGFPQKIDSLVAVGADLDTWHSFTGNETAAAGFYSSANDMAKLGISILNSSLLSPLETRRWLKPITHSSSLEESVGRPWEILRFNQPRTQRVNDLYTKVGDVVNYDSALVLSPDHQAGFVVLTAGVANGAVRSYLCDIIAHTFLPGLEDAAAEEVTKNLAGTYRAHSDRIDSVGASNSSISFRVDPDSGPGLIVESWVNNGRDTLDVLNAAFGTEDWRLYPTDLEEDVPGKSSDGVARRQAFRATIAFDPLPELGIFSRAENRGSWLGVDGAVYQNRSLDSFVFDLDKSGRAVAVTPSAFRTLLRRV